MKRNRALLFVVLLGALYLSSCSHSRVVCTTNCGGGNGNLNLTLRDMPPAGASVLNFNLPIVGISLTPASGAATPLPNSTFQIEITRLQSDSAFLGSFSVPAGSYTGLSLVYTSPTGTFLNTTNSAIGTCLANSVCNLPASAAGSLSITFAAPVVVTSALNTSLGLEFNLNNAITTSGTGALTVDLMQANVLKTVSLPQLGQPTGTLDSMEDFTGIVTALSGNTVTISSGLRGTLAANVNSSTTYNDPLGVCGPAGATVACVQINRTVSVDAQLKTDGSLSISEVDFIDSPSVDEAEGIIYLTPNPNVYGLVVTEKTVVSADPNLPNLTAGTVVTLTLNAATFAIDTKNILPVPVGFSSASDILNGQTVMAQVQSTTTGSTGVSVVAKRLLLRYSRISGTISNAPAGGTFNLKNLPAFIAASPSTTIQVQTSPNYTAFDGVTDFNALGDTNSVSVRGLLLNGAPGIFATKVRKH